MNIIIKTLTVASIVLLASCSNGQEQHQTVNEQQSQIAKDVSAEKFKNFIVKKKGFILDVRTPEEYNEGHIKGATNINFYDADFAQQLEKVNKEKPTYIYCRSGGRSGQAMNMMKKAGFKTIYNLEGGIIAWQKAGFEVVK